MATQGKNLRLIVDAEKRPLARKLFADVLGATMKCPNDALDVFIFEDGLSVGVFLVEPSKALPASDLKKAPWLEFCVDDPAETRAALAAIGVEPFEYTDKTHDYYCPACGPVFRVAKR